MEICGLKNKVIIGVLISILFYVILALYSDFNILSTYFLKIKIEFIPIILLFSFLGIFTKSIRQKILLNQIGVNLNFKDNFLTYLAGLSMIVTPFGSGEIIKAYFLKNKNYDISKTSPVFLSERFYDFLGIFMIIFITTTMNPTTPSLLVSFFGIIVISIVFGALKIPKILEYGLKKLVNFRFTKKFASDINNSHETIIELSRTKSITKASVISLIAVLFDATSVFLSFIALGIDLEFFISAQTYFVSNIIGIISLLPAGIIVTEGTMISFLNSQGVNVGVATASVILIRLTTIWFATAIGFLSIRKQKLL